jgi:hypothetical protein
MTAKKPEKLDKRKVHYRPATGSRRCRNCIMFHTDGTCDLVKGNIAPEDVCDRWESRVTKSDDLRVAVGVELPKLHAELLGKIERIELLERAGLITEHEAFKRKHDECWPIRVTAYKIMVKAYNMGYAVAPEGFGWSHEQIQNETLRNMFCPKSAETPRVSTEHHPLGREGLWHTPSKKVPEKQQLPAYIQNTAHALMRDHGTEESEAIATAIQAVRSWAAGKAFGGKVKVTPEVKAAAQRALDEWEELKRSHH